ncbi:lipoprotein [Streptomyces hygroscopicus]|uniref:META domain-containing protein n=1 Tax=Streptomyces hygroscopicus TaxID=1912 RepID=UPI00223EF61B|nr:META domain-containing protein [Streptomyces hygroscopicus]MCW7946923.1 lipoprotein [Streptomyces hygroscopicus]
MDKHRLTLTLLTLLPLSVACGTGAGSGGGSSSVGPESDAPVTGVHWRVDSLTAEGTTRSAPTGAYLRIDDQGQAHGNYGCNSFGASATVQGDRVAFGNARSTEMACDKAPMAFEAAFSRALSGGALTAAVHRNELTLTATDGARVRLVKERDASLYGTRWQVTSLVDGDVASSLPAASDKAWFTLDPKAGAASGSLGCNRFTAKATVRGGHLTLGTPTTTRKMCDGSLMDTEKTLRVLFGRTLTYRLEHRSIALTSENGRGVNAVAVR